METTPKNTSTEAGAELWELASRSCNDALRSEDLARLESLLAEDPQARHFYGFYMLMHAELAWRFRADGQTAIEGRGMAGSPAIDLPVVAAVELPHQPESRTPNPEPPFPPLSTTNYPLPAAPFVGSWAFSYMVATVIMGVAILGFWAYKITHYQHIAEAPSQSVPSDTRQEMVFVGRITGMVDVKWSDDPHYLPPPDFAHVPLDRKYILSSGLLEITYDSGAKVILQGPCTYEVESTAGGYLSLGKLTARVEEERSEVRGQRSDHYPLPTTHYPLFSVRTPTAVVTDLGTEFGVEVSDEGTTESRVFRGSVKVQVVGDGLPSPSGRGAGGEGLVVQLGAGESARVEGGDEPRITVLGASAKTADFMRRIPKVTYKRLDLVDVVAGGDGFSGRRNRSIDPTNGQVDTMASKDTDSGASFRSDGKYHRVEALPLVDGVFIPDSGRGPVQVDSAGNMFAGFPDTCNVTWKSIWAGDAIPADLPITAVLGGIDYAAPPHCLLFMHANNGITFDLEAIRRANPNSRLLRFRAVAGSSSGAMRSQEGERVSADLWVLIDGQVRFERRDIDGYSGAFRVLVPIGGDDRFLTLATTDAGNKAHGDWTMFGDPRLDLMHVDANEPKDEGGETMNDP